MSTTAAPAGTKAVSYREALTQAMREEMQRDANVFVMGEDVGQYEGAFKVTRGLLREFGESRVVDTPISEAGFVGLGIGAAMADLRPVVELMTVNFSIVALDQIVNNAAKVHYMFGGQVSCPIVLRMPGGAGHQLAAQHSHSLEAWYTHVPGLKVVSPATPYDAKGLLKTAIRDDDPVIFLECEGLYAKKVKQIDAAAKAHPDWPVFINMNWDEPPPINEKMGWTNEILGPKAITTLDAQFSRLPLIVKYYNTPAFDDPATWAGPEVCGWLKKQGKDYGLCGATDTGEADRYQAGAYMIASGCKYFHAWHIRGGHTPGQMDYDSAAKRTTRGPEMICWADGMDDFKAHRLLTDAIAEAQKSGKNAEAVKAAQEYLKKMGGIFNNDQRYTWSLQPYLGNAWMWGYEQFYDDWQEQMCKHAAAVKGVKWID